METKTAVIYSRVSSSGYQVNRQDTSRQIEDLQSYANYSKVKVVKVFEEHISGAKRNDERPTLVEAINYCKNKHVNVMLVSELSRLGRNAFEVLSTVKELKDNCINLYLQKEQFSLFDKDGKPSLFSAIMIATLSTCSELERENIKYRLNSGRAQYIRNGGKLGRKKGSVKTTEQKEAQYKEVLTYLRKGYSVRITAKLTQVSTSTVQRLKTEFAIY